MSDMNCNRSPVVAVGCSREKNIYNNINFALVATCFKVAIWRRDWAWPPGREVPFKVS